jgi:glucose-1-phosphate adenylyltransferase
MKNVLTVLLAGGAGERLHPLTRDRAKPAVPFGGMYRIIDSTLSNCINSGCKRIQVLVQYKSHSLGRHIRYAWDIMHGNLGEYIDVVPPQQRVNANWYLGTADAIYQNLYTIMREHPQEVLILSGDHIYKMDYQKMLRAHREAEADLTMAAIEIDKDEARRMGVLEVDEHQRVVGFQEKPPEPRTRPHNDNACLGSMGIYIFNAEVLQQAVVEDAEHRSSHDFGKDIIPRLIDKKHVQAYVFEDENRKPTMYWRDVGTLDSYWAANMDLVEVDPLFNLYDRQWPLHTNLPMMPPAKFVFADRDGGRFGVAVDSIVSPGCIISGGMVRRCVLSPAVRVNSYALVEESIIFNGASIGRHSRVRRAIVEKNVHLPDNSVIGYDHDADARNHRVTESGIVVVEAPERREAVMLS